MAEYDYQNRNIHSFLNILYNEGLRKSKYLSTNEIEEIISRIGIFKFKGYCYAFKKNTHSIDDILIVYFFDKYLTRIVMDLTSSIETKLKTQLVELCYKRLKTLPRNEKNRNNPFFYLIKRNYKRILDENGHRIVDSRGNVKDFKINGVTEGNWKKSLNQNLQESYSHYNLYYKNRYDFSSNRRRYLERVSTIRLREDINYPPFHYLIESATLGSIIHFIKYLKIGSFDVLTEVASAFNINQSANFVAYLERLNEVRNRVAHRERIFNRSYRSITRTGKFSKISATINNHKFIDVYLYFFFMLDWLDKYSTLSDFKEKEIEILFISFHHDYFINKESYGLISRIEKENFFKIKEFIIRGME